MSPSSQLPWQYSLWHVLAFVSIVSLLLGIFCILGFAATSVVSVVVVFSIPFCWHPRRLYVWVLPLVWLPIAFANYFYCGDEYGGFVTGSLAGLWILPFISATSPASMLPPVILAGTATLAVAGSLLDWLRLRWGIWLLIWFSAATFLFVKWFGSFPSVERALAKNGSYETYVLTSINFGLTVATVIGIVVSALQSIITCVRRWRS